MHLMKASIIIPCFNHGEFLPDAVASVTALKRDDIELIVVDDGSTDDRTRKEIDGLASRGTKVIRKQNGGPAAARNAGIAVSAGQYILPLDADNRLRPGYVEKGIQVLESHPQVGVVYGDANYMGTRSGRWQVGPFERDKLLRWNYIDTCAVYRRSVWEQNGGYDETKIVQGLEDWDFWVGALEHGWGFHYIPEIVFDYRVAKHSLVTRTFGLEPQIAAFVGRKHSALYREAFLQLAVEHGSVKLTARNLGRLLQLRLAGKFQKNGRHG
jgi:glycosyltransferase involved in cell wall biosynthesis